jgi:hypothetical protein
VLKCLINVRQVPVSVIRKPVVGCVPVTVGQVMSVKRPVFHNYVEVEDLIPAQEEVFAYSH